MTSSFFRFSYFSGTRERTPVRIENVVACGATEQEILDCLSQVVRRDCADFRRETIGPLSTETRLLNKSHGQIDWRELSNVVENAQRIDNGVMCLFIDCRLITALDDVSVRDEGECCNLPSPSLDQPLETIYLGSAYDHTENVPVAPVYLMREISLKTALVSFLAEIKDSALNEVCISKCDRILLPGLTR